MAIRERSAIHEDIAGFIAAAVATTSRSAGSGALRRRSTTVCSAIAPRVVSGRTKYKRSPSSVRPTPSIPGMSGSSSPLV
jgi:hypothetical protein